MVSFGRDMRIEILLSSQQPPCGRVGIDDAQAQPSQVWLQLLSILTVAFREAAPPPPPGPTPVRR
jgi:hypothetical protein